MPQANTTPITAKTLLRDASFQRGVADMLVGRAPRFDEQDIFGYEWGRQFGAIAPRDLPLVIKSTANPKAVKLLKRYFINGTLVNDAQRRTFLDWLMSDNELLRRALKNAR